MCSFKPMEKQQSYFIVRHGSARTAFELKESEIPAQKEGHIRVETEGFGINFADIMARKGLYQDAPPTPCVVGYESVGRTMDESLINGEKVPAGTRVVAFSRFGGYSTHVLADERAVQPIPEDIPLGEALALAVQYCTAYHCAEERVSVFPEDHVLVQAAAGGVGTALIQLLKRKGCTIYGTAGSNKKLKYIQEQGVHHPINYQKQDFAKVIKDKLGSRGLDIVFDSLGGKSYSKGFNSLGKGGRIVGYGAAEQVAGGLAVVNQLKLAANFGLFTPIQLLMNSRGMIGVNMLHVADDRPEVLSRTMKAVVDLWKADEIKPVVGAEFKAENIAEAHEFVEGRKSMGKVAVRW
ncbi:MAG: NADPH:quinone reductase-like Zn-dependent oxidoreductase [Bacteroidia bacterium]|jgi:NADPH:quinone reductase-like Zn-dependent oxidoreductase